jgi:hypothetical protein
MIVKYPVKHYSTDKVFSFLRKKILPLCHTLQFTLREYIACQNTLYSYAIYGSMYQLWSFKSGDGKTNIGLS